MKIALSMLATNKGETNCISQEWIDWCNRHSVEPYLIPNGINNLERYITQIKPDLLIITSGSAETVDREQAKTERKLIDISIKQNVPLLGVGSGMLFLNKYYGGSIENVRGHTDTQHEVIFTTPWQAIYDSHTSVNSFHDQGIRETGLGTGFAIAAIDVDGYVEAMTHKQYPITGIMWHPERAQGNSRDISLLRRINEV